MFVKLTSVTDNPVWVNLDQVRKISEDAVFPPVDMTKCTVLTFTPGEYVQVLEKPDEIIAIMAADKECL